MWSFEKSNLLIITIFKLSRATPLLVQHCDLYFEMCFKHAESFSQSIIDQQNHNVAKISSLQACSSTVRREVVESYLASLEDDDTTRDIKKNAAIFTKDYRWDDNYLRIVFRQKDAINFPSIFWYIFLWVLISIDDSVGALCLMSGSISKDTIQADIVDLTCFAFVTHLCIQAMCIQIIQKTINSMHHRHVYIRYI